MKKKILLATLAAACVMGGAAALVGCNNGGSGHSHIYSEEWSYNGTYHYHKCTVEGCKEVSGSQKHEEATRYTATSTEAGAKITYCTVEGCEWTKEEAQAALGHDYEWTFKDNATHTGTCKNDGCTDEPAEEEHNFTESTVGGFNVKTCSDCEVELAEVQVKLLKRINDKQATEYTDATLKVSLHKIGDGNYTKVYEATADPETGVATLQIQAGAYWIKVEDETNGYMSVDASWLRFNKTTAENETDSNFREIVLSEPTEYTYKLLYDGNENDPAAGVTVKLHNVYSYNGEASMNLGEGVTDENGEVTFTLASSFDLTNSSNLIVEFSGIDKENYKSEDSTVFIKNLTQTYSLSPTVRAYTIKVKAGDNFVEGVNVSLLLTEYDDELKEFVKKVKASGTTDANGQFITDVIKNTVYEVKCELPEEIAADWKLPSYALYTNTTREVVVNLVDTPAYNLTVNFPSGATCEKSGVKLIVKDLEDNVVAEGLTNEEGKFTVKLEFAEYKVYIDESTIPEGFAAISSVTTIPTTSGSNNRPTLDATTNSVSWGAGSIGEIIDVAVTVRSGSKNAYVYYENVVVKFYKNGELKYVSEPTAADGTTTIKGVDGLNYNVVFEGLPENYVCTTTTTTVEADYPDLTAALQPSANFALTIKDEDGNALAGATVSLVTYAYSTRNYYTITEEAKGVTSAGGTVNIAWLLNKNYTVNVVGADGKKYFGQANLASATQGETVTQELTVYAYDDEMPLSGSKAPITYYSGDFIDKEVLVTCSSKRDETFAFTSSDGAETLAAGTYKFEILNPCEVDYKVVLKVYDDDSMGYIAVSEPTDYMTVEKDEDGNIISVTVNFDIANEASYFNVCIGHDVGEGEAATDLFRVLVKVTKVEA